MSSNLPCARPLLICFGHALLPVAFACAASPAIAVGQAPAPASQAVSSSGNNVLTVQDMEDLRVIDASVLDTPLSPAEQEQARQNIIRQFQKSPAEFTKARPATQQITEVFRHGSLADRTALAMQL